MSEFKSWRSYRDFATACRHGLRYVRDPESEAFLEAVVRTSQSRTGTLSAGTVLWRAQLGHAWRTERDPESNEFEIQCPYAPERMKPQPDRASEGRANPKGIPYLYLSNDRDTAMCEVRPWIGSYISIANFRLTRDLKLVNFSGSQPGFYLYDEEPSPEERRESVWAHIDSAFSEPTTESDQTAEYVPTQVLSEIFKKAGFDGLIYKSNLGAGYNVALFDINAATLINCGLFRATSVSFEFAEDHPPYSVREGGEGAA